MSTLKILLEDKIFSDCDFEVQFCRCGYEKCLSNKRPEGGNRIFYSLHMVTNGIGYLEVDGKNMKLEKNDIFVIYPGLNQTYYPDSKNPWSYIWVNLAGKNLDELFGMCGCGPETFYNMRLDGSFSEKFQSLLNTYNTADSLSLEYSVMFMQIVSKMIKHKKMQKDSSDFVISPKNLVREAIIFMSNNYRLNISLSDVAAGIGVSNSYLISLFAKETNITPMRYLTLYRIAYACELLTKGTMNISEVSREVGFNDPLYFSRCFSSVKGCSPREYIKAPEKDPWLFIKEQNLDYR